jgi:uncharacterized protein YneR
VLLGYLIEKVSGETYEKFLQENIFTPLGMKDSGYDSNSAVIPHRAAGYTRGANGMANTGFIHMSIPFSAGALYSTTQDLLRWEQGLFGGKLLSPASLQKMTTPFKDDYAFGVQVHTVSGRKVVDHGGGIEGFNTFLAYYPDSQVTIVALANVNGNAPQEIAGKLGPLAHGEKIALRTERKEITIPPSILAAYVGTYQLAPKVNIMITVNDDQLVSQMSGQGKIPLFAESETLFFPKVVDAEIEFGKDEKGPFLVLHQGGRDQKAVRTSDTVLERKEVAIAPGILAKYAGTYQLRQGFDLVVTADGDQLMAQATGQGKFRMFPESETKFFSKAVDLQVEFFPDEKSAVSHLILHQGPVETKAAKQ